MKFSFKYKFDFPLKEFSLLTIACIAILWFALPAIFKGAYFLIIIPLVFAYWFYNLYRIIKNVKRVTIEVNEGILKEEVSNSHGKNYKTVVPLHKLESIGVSIDKGFCQLSLEDAEGYESISIPANEEQEKLLEFLQQEFPHLFLKD